MFFFDTLHGIVAVNIDSGSIIAPPPTGNDSGRREYIFYTSNTRSWRQIALPRTVKQINAIRLIHGKLCAACFGPDLLISSDSGKSWNFSGLGLGDAWDVYDDPNGVIRTIPYTSQTPNYYATFARIDKFHCLFTTVPAGASPSKYNSPGSVQISNDGGITWHNTGINIFERYGCYGETCAKIFAFGAEDLQALVYCSFDSGTSWERDTIDSLGYANEFLDGAAGVIYTRRLRSTNDGETWTSANMPGSLAGGVGHIAVFGPLGQYVVVPTYGGISGDSELTLYLTTTGGDGALHDVTDPLDSTGFPMSLADTIRVASNCSGVRVPIPLEGCVDSIYTVVNTDSLYPLRSAGASNFLLGANQRDTAWFEVLPGRSPAADTVTVRFQNSWHCSSWEEVRTIIVTNPSASLSISSAPLIGSCGLVDDTAHIAIDSCQSLIIRNVAISNISSNRLQFQSPLPDTLQFDRHWLPFEFDPHDTSFYDTATVELTGYYEGTTTQFDTTFTIILTAIPSQPKLSIPDSLDFGMLRMCANSVADTDLAYFKNWNCTPDTITSLFLIGASFDGPKVSLPVVIRSGDSVGFKYIFAPPDSGTFTGTVKLRVTSMGLIEDTVILLTGHAVQGMGVLALRSTSLQMGSLSFCSGDTLVTDTLRNLGCDTLVLTDLHVSGDTAFSLVSVPDSLLVSGDSAIVSISFAPRLKGPHAATLTCHERNIVNDPGHDTAVTLSGFGLGGPTALSADTTTRNFGSLFACEYRDTTLWLANPGCDTLMLDSMVFSSPALSSVGALPPLLPPGDTIPVVVQYAAGSGVTADSVTFFSDANDGARTKTIPLVATIIPPLKLTVGLEAPTYAAHAAQTVTFYVILTGDTGAAASELKGLRFVLTHNDDLLELRNASGLIWSPGSATTTRTPSRSDTFAWSAPTAAHSPDTIGTLTFQVYLTDSSATPLSLSDITFNGPLNLPLDCIASVDSNGSGFQYLYRCGDLTIQQAMEHEPPFSITGVVPNPASTVLAVTGTGIREPGSGNPGSELRDPKSDLEFQLFDALGNCVLVHHSPLSTIHFETALNVSGLPSGIYFLRISSGGYAESRSVAIER